MELMKITGYKDGEFTAPFEGSPYSVMINPDTIKWQRSIDYNVQQLPDSSSPSQKFKSTPSDKLNFDIVIDCTGIIDDKRTQMSVEISALEKIIFTYNFKYSYNPPSSFLRFLNPLFSRIFWAILLCRPV